MATVSKEALLKIVADSKDAEEKLAKIDAAAEEFKKQHPELEIRVDTAAATAKIAVLREELKSLGKDDITTVGEEITGLGAKLGALSNFGMPALIGSIVALSPVLVGAGAGLAGFGAAAFKDISPILAASQQTGGLAANLNSLDGYQRTAAEGLLNLGGQFTDFSKTLEPEVMTGFDDALKIGSDLLGAFAPVAKTAGDALDTVLGQIDAEMKSGQFQQFFAFLAANAGPDIELLAKTFGDVVKILPSLLQNLQPVAQELLNTVDDVAKLTSAVSTLEHEYSKWNTSAQQTGGWQKTVSDAVARTVQQMFPGIAATQQFKSIMDKLNGSTSTAKSKTDLYNQSLQTEGQKAQTVAQQIQAIDTNLTNLIGTTDTAINDQISFTNDQANFEAALKNSNGQIGLQNQAARDTASAMTQWANDTLTLSQNILQQTGSTQKAAGPLQTMLGILQNMHSTDPLVAQEIVAIQKAIDALKSKQITITVNGQVAGNADAVALAIKQGVSNQTIIHAVAGAQHRASGGPVSGLAVVGEQGPELAVFPPGTNIINSGTTGEILSRGAGMPSNAFSFGGAQHLGPAMATTAQKRILAQIAHDNQMEAVMRANISRALAAVRLAEAHHDPRALVLRLEKQASGLESIFIQWLKDHIRVAGGGGPSSVQVALGQ